MGKKNPDEEIPHRVKVCESSGESFAPLAALSESFV